MLRAVCLVMVIASAGGRGGADVEKQKQAILREGFLDEKRELGRRLGRNKSPAARAALLSLLEDDSYWNRLAAADGILQRAQPDTDRILLQRMLRDHMIASDVRKGFQARGGIDGEVLVDVWNDAPVSKQGELIEMMGETGGDATLALLKEIVADRRSRHRSAAMSALARRGTSVRDFILSYKDDSTVRRPVLAYMLEHGSQQDLPYFLAIIRTNERPENVLVAYTAVERWADAETAQQVLVDALRSGDETLVRGALHVFKRTDAPAVQPHLCHVVETARSQETRLTAAGVLARHPTRAAVPCLISALKEDYSATGMRPIDVVPALATMGLSTIFQALNEKWSKNHFYGRRSEIVRALERTTGQEHGSSYAGWKDWAIHQGYSVDGENLVQRLFSGRPDERKAAIRAAIGLIGTAEARRLPPSKGSLSEAQERELTLALARVLLERGILSGSLE